MRRIFGALICALGLCTPAAAGPLDAFQTYVNQNIVSNGQGKIQGSTVNTALLNLVPVFASMGSWTPQGTFVLNASALPTPTATTLGGVRAGSAPSHQYMCGINVAGNPIYCQPSVSDISGFGTSAQKNVGSSVVDPGTGNLESVLPIQTVTGAVKAFGQPDLNIETRRSNGGTAMTDAFPAASTTGLVNGARIVVENVDASASDTITAGAGTTFSGSSSTDVVGPLRTIIYGWDAGSLTWRREFNTGSALLSTNNLGEVASPSIALGNLGGGSLSGNQTWSGTNTFTGALIGPYGTLPGSCTNGQVFTTSAGLYACSGGAWTGPFTTAAASILRGYLSGLTLSNDGTSPNTVLDTAAGQATSDDATTLMALASAYTKTTGAWAVGSGNGALDTGSVAANTWYHVFLIERTDTQVVDLLFSTSATSPTMPTNYTKKRRIGSFRTDGSSNILAFSQNGDEFLWSVAKGDVVVTNLAGSATLYTLTVPTGVKVNARIRFTGGSSSSGALILMSSPDESSQVSGNPAGNAQIYTNASSSYSAGEANIRTNTSGQIRAVSNVANSIFQVATFGWIDTRGRWN